MDSTRQLTALFGGLEDGMKFLVCSKRNFAGRWFESLADADSHARAEAEVSDVYIGCGLRKTEPPAGQRGKEDEIDGIVGLWLDVDFLSGTAHKKRNLPASVDEAHALLREVLPVLPPSLVIFSGHGLQAWWLFPEPWLFRHAEDRAKAKAFSMRFNATAKAVARLKGFIVDPVYDLSRVFRLAGTYNRKTDPAIETRIVSPAADAVVMRYDFEDLDACFVAEEAIEEVEGKGLPVDPLVLTANRRPPVDALVALVSNHEKAKATWERKRPDLADQSGSSYDFSLAIFAVRYGWTDQEVADLLIARRVKHGEDLKTTRKGTLRLDYYQRTILAAKKVVANEAAAKAYAATDGPPLVADGKPVDGTAKGKILDKARGVFGLPILRFVQHGEQRDARFSFVLADGSSVDLGGAIDLDDQRVVRSLVYTMTGRYPQRMKGDAWTTLFEELGAIREVIDNPESGKDGRFAALLFEYLSAKTGAISAALRSGGNWQDAISLGDPFVKDGRIFLCVTSIERYVKTVYSRKMDVREIWTTLPEWGFENSSVKTRVGSRQIARRYWSIPIDDLAERKGFEVPIVYGPPPAVPRPEPLPAGPEVPDGGATPAGPGNDVPATSAFDVPEEWK